MRILPPVSIEARRLLPSRWDLLAAVLVLGFIVAFADVSRFLVHPLSSISGDYLKLNPIDLPGYALRTSLRISPGRRRLSWKLAIVSSTFFQRTIGYTSFTGKTRRSSFAMGSSAGSETMYVGER